MSVDRAMEWGYAWDAGPFKQMDAMGLEFLRGGFGALGLGEPPLLRTAQESFYRRPGNGERYLTFVGQYSPVDELAGTSEPRRAAAAQPRDGSVAGRRACTTSATACCCSSSAAR